MHASGEGRSTERGKAMTGPFIYVGTWAIKPGKLDDARKFLAEHVDYIERNEPRLIAFHMYLDPDGMKGGVVQVHPDAESMDTHMELIAEHLSTAGDWIGGIVHEQAFGTPTESFSEALRGYAAEGIPVTVLPVHEGGFTRVS